MVGEEVSCSHCGALLLIPAEVIFSSLECPCCRAKLVPPRAAQKHEREPLIWGKLFAIGLLGLSLSLLFLGCVTAAISSLQGLAVFMVGGLVFGGVILLALANDVLLWVLPQPWARTATVGLTLLLLLSWLILLVASCSGFNPFA